jgi:hypothetical protein
MNLYDLRKDCFNFKAGRQNYYCGKCEYMHYFDSEIGKEHIQHGKSKDYIIILGRTIIDLDKRGFKNDENF